MPTVAEQIKWLQDNYKPDDHIAVAIWGEEDVLEMAENLGKKITRQNAQDILDNIERRHDSEIGITWMTIQVALEDYPDVEEGEADVKRGICPSQG